MPPHSYLEWIAGANMPRPQTARPKRRIFAEYETDDEDEEVEFLVRSNKKSPRKAKEEDKEEDKPAAKVPSLKSALKKVAAAAAASDVSESALSSDKEVETSGSEGEATSASTSASASVVEDHSRDFDPECPCHHCVKAQKALKKSRFGKKAKRVSFSDDENDTDVSDDAETVHNFFKWNQAMEAKIARDKDAKDYKEYLADKAKKEEAAQKETEKQKEDTLREKIKKEEEKKKNQEEEKKREESKQKEEKEKGQGKRRKAKDNKGDSSSKVAAETSNPEFDTTKDGTDAETSNTDSQKGGKWAADTKDKKAAKAAPPPSEPSESDTQETTAIQLLMEQLLKKQKKDKSKKKKRKHKDKERVMPEQEKTSIHPASSHDTNWLMPPRSSIVHVEHSMEAPTDPRPNAFFDNRNGVMRVYHGSNYGNPTGGLYQKQGPRAVASPRHCEFSNNSNDYGSGFPPQRYGQFPGFPPPHAAQSMSQMPPANADQWFQGTGTTVVPGTPAGGHRNPEFTKPIQSGFHSFTDMTSHLERSPRNTHRQHTNPSHQTTGIKPTLPTQSPGFDPAYFSSTVGMGPNSFNTTPGWGVQNTQSIDTSSKPSNSDQWTLMAEEVAELKARMSGSVGGNWNGLPSAVHSAPPAQRISPPNPVEAVKTNDWPSDPKTSPAKKLNNAETRDNHASATPASAGNGNWIAPTNNNNNNKDSPQKTSSWENGGNNDTTTWNKNNDSPPKTSPTHCNNSNNNNTAGSFQNVSEWSSQSSAQAQGSMPGAYPSPSMTNSVKNDFGSADWNTSQNNTAQGWEDATGANSSGGYWDSYAANEDKGSATAGW